MRIIVCANYKSSAVSHQSVGFSVALPHTLHGAEKYCNRKGALFLTHFLAFFFSPALLKYN